MNDNVNDSVHSTGYQFGFTSKTYLLDPKFTPQITDLKQKAKMDNKKENKGKP